MFRGRLYLRILGALLLVLLTAGLPMRNANAQSSIIIPPDLLYPNWPNPIHSAPPLDSGFINNVASICQSIPGMICPPIAFGIPVPPPPCDCICACSLCDQLITVAYTQLLHEALRLLYFGTPDPIDGDPDLLAGGPSEPGLFTGSSFLLVPSRLAMHQSFLTGTIFMGKVFEPTTRDPENFFNQPYHITKGIGADIAGPAVTGNTGIGILPALMWMTEDLTKNMMHQTFMVGAFLDAKNQLETQLLFQELTADAHRDYRPDIEMCTIGGATRGLAASHFNSKATAAILSQRAMDRWLGSRNTEAAEGGRDADRRNRVVQFAERYCNPYENNPSFTASGTRVPPTGLGLVCEAGAPDAETVNKDIDYYRNLWQQKTLDINYGDGTQTEDEIDIMALAANLYSHDVYDQPTEAMLLIEQNQDEYLDLRASLAKRSVAQNSFDALVGLKAAGVPSSSPSMQYLSFILKDLGLPENLIFMILGDNPSYMAQLQFLSKQIYQRPEFYINLYTTPANVERKQVAMQAIGSILERDIYESHLRSEAIMSVLLEMKLIPEQGAVQNILNGLKGQTRNP